MQINLLHVQYFEIDMTLFGILEQQQHQSLGHFCNHHHVWQWFQDYFFFKEFCHCARINTINKIKFTGNKFQNKKYYRHTGHPGGIKETTPEKLHDTKPDEVLKLAVKRMLPGGALAKKQLGKLKIYKGSNHPHEAQNPEKIEISKLNNKNVIRN